MMKYSDKTLRKLCLNGVISSTDFLTFKNVQRVKRRNFKVFKPFKLQDFSDADSELYFRFKKPEILRLCRALGVPAICTTKEGVSFSGIEGLCILLRPFCYPNRLCELTGMLRRDETALSRIAKWMTSFIFTRFSYLLRTLDHTWTTREQLLKFTEAFTARGSPYPNLVWLIDGTARPICRPSKNQHLQYSGYKKQHVLKYQSVVFPNGLIGRLDGPINGRRHDSAILHISSLLTEMEQKFVMDDGTWFVIYGDPGYANQKFIKVGFKNYTKLTENQKKFNRDMSAIRVHVEYGFGKIIQLFAFLDYKKNQKLLLQPLMKQSVVAAILANCHTCLRSSQICDFFECFPPELEEYLVPNAR